MNNDLDLFICAHKDFKDYPHNDTYKIVTGEGCLHNEYDLPIYIDNDTKYSNMNNVINEFTRYWYVHENLELKKYVGFCAYSKFFKFFDNVPDTTMLFMNNDIIVNKPSYGSLSNILSHYSKYHNICDYYITRQIITYLYDNITIDDIKKCENYLIPRNIFIMPSDKFHKYCKFVSSVIDEYMRFMRFDSFDTILRHVKNNWEFYNKNGSTPEYQARIVAYLIERITTIFIKLNFDNIGFIETVHYNVENNDVGNYFDNTKMKNIYHKYE